jgi:hypothetical protein
MKIGSIIVVCPRCGEDIQIMSCERPGMVSPGDEATCVSCGAVSIANEECFFDEEERSCS